MTALADLTAALQGAEREVFRLEGHQSYAGDAAWQAHRRGERWVDSTDLAAYCAMVSAARGRGAHWSRVRVVVDPWTDYTRWEIEQHYPHNLAAGEDVWLVRGRDLGVPDFWIVDDRAWMLHYDSDGAMTVVEATERARPLLRVAQAAALVDSEPLAVPTR